MIAVYGSLARKLKKNYPNADPKRLPMVVKSAGEAVRALESQFKGFKSWIRRKGYYKVVRGDDVMNDSKSLNEKELTMNFSETTWHIMPIAAGAGGKGGIISIVVGALMIIAGVIVGVVFGWTGVGGVFAAALIGGGIGLMGGGIVQMLSPVPKLPKNSGNEDTPSYLFNGALNVNQPGYTVPVAYGKTFIGSIVTSFGIKVEAYS